jgi:hypothetical protein
MKRFLMMGGLMAAALTGCVSTEGGAPMGGGAPTAGGGKFMSNAFDSGSAMAAQAGIHQGVRVPQGVAGLQGPWGTPVPVAAPYTTTAPQGRAAAMAMLASSQPLDVIQQTKFGQEMANVNANNSLAQAGGRGGNGLIPGAHVPASLGISPPGVPAAPGMPSAPPPSNVYLAKGGPLPLPGAIRQVNGHGGMGGMIQPMPPSMPGVVAANGAIPMGGMPGGPGMGGPAGRTQILFNELPGMKVSWYASGADGQPGFTQQSIATPGRYNFAQGAVYRLKVTDIPNLPEVDLYPTLEVVPANIKSATFLAHSPVPISVTQEDLQQVSAGNFVVKVIYLPDPQFQDLALAGGPDELVSSRLEPGVDPIQEAQKRGSILAILRLGKIDLELNHSPAMDAPPGGMAPPGPGAPAGPAGSGGPVGAALNGLPNLVPPPGPVAPGVNLPAPAPSTGDTPKADLPKATEASIPLTPPAPPTVTPAK